jgi:two-component system, sensor histidine kinase PdtaS
MNQAKIADILELVNRKVREKWRNTDEKVYEINNDSARNLYQAYLLEGAEYEPGKVNAATVSMGETAYAQVKLPRDNDNDDGEFFPAIVSTHNMFPEYYAKLIEAVRADDVDAFCDFLSAEGAKWALVEVPINDLIEQNFGYAQTVVETIHALPVGQANNEFHYEISEVEKQELLQFIAKLNRQTISAISKGYVGGRDRLLMRTLSSNHSVNESESIRPLVKGTTMGGFGEQVRRSLDELEALHKVNSAVNSSLDLDSVLNLTVVAVSEVMAVDICSVYVFEQGQDGAADRMKLRAAKGLNPHAIGNVTVQIGEGVTGASAKEGKPISVYDVWSDSRFRYVPELNEESSRSMLSVPIILFTREKLVGVINVQSRSYRSWTTEEIRFLEMVAGEIALAIENAMLYQQTDERLRRKVQELTTLREVSNMIAATLDLSQVLNLIVIQATKLAQADMAAIYELKEASRYLTIVANHGLSEDYVKYMRVELGEGPIGRAAELNRPVNVWDAHFELHPGEEKFYHNQYRSAMCVPLAGARGVLGVITLYTREHRHFGDEHLQIISAFADQAAITIENARLYEEVRRGLSIKSALLQEMHHRVRNNLQTVAALLSMQMRRADNMAVAVPLAESVARIQSIAAIHDLLSRDDIGVTTVHAVAKEIVDIASVSIMPPDKRIRFKLDEGHVPVASKEATLLAILVMELISNAIFHGFEDVSEGEIRISAFVNEGRTQIEVRDNGRGYPPDFNPATGKTGLGLQIVQTLVTKDLQGIFKMENINGWATATIIFNSVYGLKAEEDLTTADIRY